MAPDMVALKEGAELVEKGKLTSSCCPAFVSYIEKSFPDLLPYVSHNLSPMGELGRYLKEKDPNCKVVFIGPCTAKKAEIKKDKVKPYIDSVMTFEELQALIDAKEINVTALEEDELNDASFYGRIFAHSGGLTGAVGKSLKEQNLDFEVMPATCSGILECEKPLCLNFQRAYLKKTLSRVWPDDGGCVNGAVALLTTGQRRPLRWILTQNRQGITSPMPLKTQDLNKAIIYAFTLK